MLLLHSATDQASEVAVADSADESVNEDGIPITGLGILLQK